MNFTYEELARLNAMIGISLMSGKVEFDEISESVHRKVTEELCIRMRQGDGIGTESEKEVV